MPGARENLAHASERLRLAFSDLKAVDEVFLVPTAGLAILPLSEAAEKVSQGARTAADVASRVLKAAEVAEAAASKAAAAVKAVQRAKAEAAAAAEAAAVATQKAAAAAEAAKALEVKIQPSVPVEHKCVCI